MAHCELVRPLWVESTSSFDVNLISATTSNILKCETIARRAVNEINYLVVFEAIVSSRKDHKRLIFLASYSKSKVLTSSLWRTYFKVGLLCSENKSSVLFLLTLSMSFNNIILWSQEKYIRDESKTDALDLSGSEGSNFLANKT